MTLALDESASYCRIQTSWAWCVSHIAGGFAFSNLTIDTPAAQSRSFKGKCHFKSDAVVSGLSRHTHRWGTTFSVVYSGGPNDGRPIWTSDDWEHGVSTSPPRQG